MWFYLYIIIDILVMLYYYDFYDDVYSRFIRRIGALVFVVLMMIPGIIIVELFRIPRLNKLKKHPDFTKYKNEFEEHIQQKERELFPEDY
jgi:hypothetical protein